MGLMFCGTGIAYLCRNIRTCERTAPFAWGKTFASDQQTVSP
jgi:hypothetical protein